MQPHPRNSRTALGRCLLLAAAFAASGWSAAAGAQSGGDNPALSGAGDEATKNEPVEQPVEFRAAWVATVANIDWPSKPGLSVRRQKRELIEMLDMAQELGLNALVFQIRPHADALYRSELEPWSPYLTGRMGRAPRPAYDPLEMILEEGHKRGIEIHAWLNPYRAGHPDYKGPYPDNHVSKTMPDAVYKLGDSGMWWIDPAHPEARAHTLAVIEDVLTRYDIDGIHFDDYFYPYPSYLKDFPEGEFPDGELYAAYQKDGGELSRDDWRRDQVNTLVREIHDLIERVKPEVRFGISPFGLYRPGFPSFIQGFDQYDQLYADVRLWLTEGWVDYLAPQLYWPIEKPAQSFTALLRWWHENNPKGRDIYAGLYTSRLLADKPGYRDTEIPLQVEWSRLLTPEGLQPGHIHFSIKALQQNPGGLVEKLRPLYAAQEKKEKQAAAEAQDAN